MSVSTGLLNCFDKKLGVWREKKTLKFGRFED